MLKKTLVVSLLVLVEKVKFLCNFYTKTSRQKKVNLLTKYLVKRRKKRKQQPMTALSHLHCNHHKIVVYVNIFTVNT